MIIDFLNEPCAKMANAINRLEVENPKVYGDFLAQTFYYVTHSTRMLALSASKMSRQEEPFFRRFVEHMSEEASHEGLAERDLKDLGYKPTDFFHRPETRALWEPQFCKIEREDHFSLFGYILALEQFSCLYLPEALKKIDSIYEGKANKFVKLHAEEDPDHVEKAIKIVERLDEERKLNICVNIVQTANAYSDLVDSCNRAHSSKSVSFDRYIENQI